MSFTHFLIFSLGVAYTPPQYIFFTMDTSGRELKLSLVFLIRGASNFSLCTVVRGNVSKSTQTHDDTTAPGQDDVAANTNGHALDHRHDESFHEFESKQDEEKGLHVRTSVRTSTSKVSMVSFVIPIDSKAKLAGASTW